VKEVFDELKKDYINKHGSHEFTPVQCGRLNDVLNIMMRKINYQPELSLTLRGGRRRRRRKTRRKRRSRNHL
jgi:hypothetical protein